LEFVNLGVAGILRKPGAAEIQELKYLQVADLMLK
jgi:hypothetical protein